MFFEGRRYARGERIAMGTWRSTLAGPIPGPVVGSGAQAFGHGVLPDVIELEIGLGEVAQAVVEEILLPDDTVRFGVESLPLADGFSHGLLRRKRQDGVEMVGHEEENGGMPALPLFVVVYRVEQGAG